MVKKCYVRWAGRGLLNGPFEITQVSKRYIELLVGELKPLVPRDWTIGADDGWTLWEGGECPVAPGTEVEVTLRSGAKGSGPGPWRWTHLGNIADVIAYRIVEEPKTLDQAWDDCDEGMSEPPPLSTILNDWWWDGEAYYCKVEAYDQRVPEFWIRYQGWVDRDWFTGRRHLTAEELAEELDG